MLDSEKKNINHLLQIRYGLIGESIIMHELMQKIIQIAPTDLTVLITGETGTGKEVFANALHGLSKRKKSPFVSVNCGAIPETLLESELFGHEKGAFTGASDQRKGFFEVANKGTILLDEIGEMPVGTQVKLLRVLESGEFSRLGASTIHKIDVRVLAATNRALEQEINDGNFRQDLFFRLKSVHIDLPPLRKHPEDIPALVSYFAKKTAEKLSAKFDGISDEALQLMMRMFWPGNVRELRNLIETIVTIEQGALITPSVLKKYMPPALPAHDQSPQPPEKALIALQDPQSTDKFELGLIFRTLLEIKNEISLIRDELSKQNEAIEGFKMEQYVIQNEEHEKYDSGEEYIEALEELRIDEMEKKLIVAALKRNTGNRRHAALELGISERTLYRKISEYNLGDQV